MDANNTFDQASTTFLGLAEYYGILQNGNKTDVPTSMMEKLEAAEEIKDLEKQLQNLNLKLSEAEAIKSNNNLKALLDRIEQMVDHLKQDLAYLEQHKDSIPDTLAAAQNQDGEILMCTNPKVVMKFLKCLSESITTLGLSSSTGAAEINWEEILTKMDEVVNNSTVISMNKCLEIMNSALAECIQI